MRSFSRLILSTFLCVAVGITATVDPVVAQQTGQHDSVPEALYNFVQHDDGSFAWEVVGKQQLEEGSVTELKLTSQNWQGIEWSHALYISEPKHLTYRSHVLLFITGGRNGRKPGADDLQRGLALAKLSGSRVATLHQVPNQPLLDGRVEDDLITETWLRYLKTGDEKWPLLFPMVKSAVKAMDAIQQLAEMQWESPVQTFVITGASKRGWTSWLTPVVDKRIVATAPIVIDVLNFRAQMKHQLDTWGKYSDQIYDYSSKGLIVEGEESERERQLRLMMDPYTYRADLKLPKLLVNGTNDPYWVIDAMQFYWNDLQGPKYVLQVPNAGHGLEGGQELALSTIAAFSHFSATKTPLPELEWQCTADGDSVSMQVTCTLAPRKARLWLAESEDKDFRDEEWQPRELPKNGSGFVSKIPKPKSGYLAQYAELEFDYQGLPFSLCTLIYRH